MESQFFFLPRGLYPRFDYAPEEIFEGGLDTFFEQEDYFVGINLVGIGL